MNEPQPSWTRTLYIMTTAQFIAAVGTSTTIPFLALYVQTLYRRTSLDGELLAGMVYSASGFTLMFAAPIWGGLADRLGRKIMVERAIFGGSVILFAMSFVQFAEDLVLLRAVQGLISGRLAASNALMASRVPRERMGYAMGTLQAGHWVGIATGPFIGGVLADIAGYHSVFIVTGCLLALAGVLVHMGVNDRVPPKISMTFCDVSKMLVSNWRSVLGIPGIRVTYILRFLSNLANSMLLPVIPLFMLMLLQDDSKVNTYTGLVFALNAMFSTVTAVYLGRLGDKIGHNRIFLISSCLLAVVYFVHGLASESWHLLVLQALSGAASGGIIPTLSALLVTHTDTGTEGSIYGLDNSIKALSRAVGPMIGVTIMLILGPRTSFIAAGFVVLVIIMLTLWKLLKSNPG